MDSNALNDPSKDKQQHTPRTPEHYWLEGWLQANSFRSAEEAARALDDWKCLEEASAVCRQWRDTNDHQNRIGEAEFGSNTLLAGPGLDFWIQGCGNQACAHSQVERLLRHSLHFYDHILLPDVLGDLLTGCGPGPTGAGEYHDLLSALASYFSLRRLGALPFVSFYPTKVDWKDRARERGQLPLMHPDRQAFCDQVSALQWDDGTAIGQFRGELDRALRVDAARLFVWRISHPWDPEDIRAPTHP